MTALDFWLKQAEWYVGRRKAAKARQCLRIAANCNPSLRLQLEISKTMTALEA